MAFMASPTSPRVARRGSTVLATGAAAAGLVLVGCAGTPTGDGPAETSTGELVSGPGFDADTMTIRIGSMVPTSGVFEPNVTSVTGMEAYFHRATQPGGPLEGFTVDVRNVDTQYNPTTAIPLYSSLADDSLMLANVLGSSIVRAVLPQIEADNLLAIPSSTDHDLLSHPNLLPFAPMYGTYQVAAMEYFADVEDMNDATFCALLQDDEYGEQVEGALELVTEELDLAQGTVVRYPNDHEDFTPQISRLRDAGCEVVTLAGGGETVQHIAVRSVQLDFDAMWIASNTAYNSTIATGAGADYIAENVRFTVTGTEWGDDSAPGQAMMEEDLDEIDPDHVPYANSYQTGYMSAIAATAVLEQAIADGDLSREHLLEVAAGLGEVDYYGLAGGTVDYGGSLENRQVANGVSLFAVDPEAPTGLRLVHYGYESDVAAQYNEMMTSEH